MFGWMYQPGRGPTPEGVPCSEPLCPAPATHERCGLPLCFGHFLVALQWEQPAVAHEDAS